MMTKIQYCIESIGGNFEVLIFQFGPRGRKFIAVYVVDEMAAQLFLSSFFIDMLITKASVLTY